MNELRHKMDQKVTNYYKYFWRTETTR